MLNEIIVGFGLIAEEILYDIKHRSLLVDFALIFFLVVFRHVFGKIARTDKTRQIGGRLIAALIILLCIVAFREYHARFNYIYKTYVLDMRPIDLEVNYHASLEPELYRSTLGDNSKWVNGNPAISTPPAFSILRLSTYVLGDSFEEYAANYNRVGVLSIIFMFAMYFCFAFKKLGMRGMLNGDMLIHFFVNAFLFLTIAVLHDINLGNTSFLVGVLVAFQLLLTCWENPASRFLQGFILLLAWWVKPNIILVVWCLAVFSVSRKQYVYLLGMLAGVVIPILASLMLPNITLETYVIYITKVSSIIELFTSNASSNLSVVNLLFTGSGIAYKVFLVLFALFMLWFTLKVKGHDFVRYEILAFAITYSPWAHLWGIYLIPLAVIMWVNVVNKTKEGRPTYLETAIILPLSWTAFIVPDLIGVNLSLLIFALIYVWRHVNPHYQRRQVST